ncbi:MAG: class IV adenylate cyclase [Patescibacteria group bacterium]
MSFQDIEIEIKLPLDNPDDVRKFLDAHAEPKAKNVFQKDTYFVPAHRNFLAVEYPFEWLRIRETANKSFLTYKHYHPENVETTHCDEYESIIENPEAVKKIFNDLDIKSIVIVEKTRSTWMFEDVEVAIDDVKNLGAYTELEATLPYETPQAARAYLYEVLSKLGAKIREEDVHGYPYMILEKEEKILSELNRSRKEIV